MAELTFPITQAGVIVDLVVGASRVLTKAHAAAGIAVPPPFLLRALIDTGSDETLVEVDVVNQLGILPKRQVYLQTAALEKPANFFEYDVSLAIVSGGVSIALPETWRVLGGEMEPSAPFEACIGRDLLAMFHAVYDGPRSTFVLKN